MGGNGRPGGQGLKQIVLDNGGSLEGLENRIKTPSSVFEKAYGRPNPTPVSAMNDIIRYTETQSPENLVSGVERTLESLESQGYKILKLKNTWLDEMNPYNGINVQIEAPNGQIFELQFHTPESFELKNGALHELYEQLRCINNENMIMELMEKMQELSDCLLRPSNIKDIQNIP